MRELDQIPPHVIDACRAQNPAFGADLKMRRVALVDGRQNDRLSGTEFTHALRPYRPSRTTPWRT
jgi:hypothetical protein